MSNVTETSDKGEPDPFAEIAAELRRIADDVIKLAGSDLPKPSHVALDIHAGGVRLNRDDDQTARAVDALGVALLGQPGTARKMHDDSYHYGTEATQRGPIKVHVYDSVSTQWARDRERNAELALKEAELEKLRAEVAELRSGLGFSREADDPTPVSPARVPLHTGGMVDGDVLVDETVPDGRVIGRAAVDEPASETR